MAILAKGLSLLHAQAGNLIMALCAMISALLGLGHALWWWLFLVAAAWLIGFAATTPSGRSALHFQRLGSAVLFYIFSLAGAAICYAVGLAVSMF